MPKIFISYARDGGFGEKLAAQTQPQLQAAGYMVFRDVTDLNPGDRWDTKLEFELETSDAVVLIVSEKVRRSEWVHNEISMAKEIGLPIIPVLSEKIRMPLWLRHLQSLDFSEQVAWEKLLRAIENQGVTSNEKAIPPQLEVSKKAQSKPPHSEKAVDKTSSILTPSWAENTGKDNYGNFADLQVNDVTQRFRFIKAGTFWRGSPASEPERRDNETRHPVTLSKPFWLADTACTQALWQNVMGINPSSFKKNTNNPVEMVSWNDAQEFIRTLNYKVSGLNSILPSEAQWEYSCRAGNETAFSFGHIISPDHVNHRGQYPDNYWNKRRFFRANTVEVKSLDCNQWGLYEMHGNVQEWCSDIFRGYLEIDSSENPSSGGGNTYVLRGGSWFDLSRHCRSAYRGNRDPAGCDSRTGFRLSAAC